MEENTEVLSGADVVEGVLMLVLSSIVGFEVVAGLVPIEGFKVPMDGPHCVFRSCISWFCCTMIWSLAFRPFWNMVYNWPIAFLRKSNHIHNECCIN